MSDTVKIRIGVQSARELELEVDDPEVVVKQLEDTTGWVVWIVDAKGRRHGVVTDKLAFVQIDSTESRLGVGFSS